MSPSSILRAILAWLFASLVLSYLFGSGGISIFGLMIHSVTLKLNVIDAGVIIISVQLIGNTLASLVTHSRPSLTFIFLNPLVGTAFILLFLTVVPPASSSTFGEYWLDFFAPILGVIDFGIWMLARSFRQRNTRNVVIPLQR